ncbi:hypothetical protein LINPERHAP1_LOCUS13105 [Linum perenne]
MDSRAAIALIQDPNHVTHHHAIEVLQFRDLLAKDWTVEICHIYREGNLRLQTTSLASILITRWVATTSQFRIVT